MAGSDYLRGTRVVVAGAGVIGATVAYRLAQAGADVTVVERRHPGAGASGASFAWLNAVDKPPRAYQRLSALGIRDMEDLADELGGGWLRLGGSLHWADRADAARETALAESMRQLVAWGARADRLAPEQVRRELEPDLRIDPGAVEAVWLVSRSGWLDPVALCRDAVAEAERRYGARMVRGEIVALRLSRGLIDSVALADGSEVGADLVVNAAGPDAARLAALAGARLPLERVPGLLLTTAPAPVRLGRVLYGPLVHVRPDGGSRLMVQREGLDSHVLGERPIPAGDPRVGEAMDRAREILPGLAGVGVEGLRMGIRAIPRDGYPIVGIDPEVGNLYHAVTHSGVTLAARLARLVTEELTGEADEALGAYRPGRFAAGRSPLVGGGGG